MDTIEFDKAVLEGLKFLEGFEEIPIMDKLLFAVNYARNYLMWAHRTVAYPSSDGSGMYKTYEPSPDKALEEIISEIEYKYASNTNIIEDHDNREDGLWKNDYSKLSKRPLGF